MSVLAFVPGIRRGHMSRNVAVGLVVLAALALVVAPLVETYRPVRGC